MSALFARLGTVMALALPLVIASRFIYIKIKKREARPAREICFCLFFTYAAGLLALVFQPGTEYYGGGHIYAYAVQRIKSMEDVNLVPFATIKLFFNSGWNARFVTNVIANVLMFSPIGFFLPLLWKAWQSLWKNALLGLCFPLLIETVQLFIGRSTDVDDIILNASGILLGFFIYSLAAKINPRLTMLSI